MYHLKNFFFMITNDQAIHLDGFTSLQSRGIQAYWHEKKII